MIRRPDRNSIGICKQQMLVEFCRLFAKEQIKQAKYDENSTFVSIVRKKRYFLEKSKNIVALLDINVYNIDNM